MAAGGGGAADVRTGAGKDAGARCVAGTEAAEAIAAGVVGAVVGVTVGLTVSLGVGLDVAEGLVVSSCAVAVTEVRALRLLFELDVALARTISTTKTATAMEDLGYRRPHARNRMMLPRYYLT